MASWAGSYSSDRSEDIKKRELRVKRLLFRARRRGMKELDLLVGDFIEDLYQEGSMTLENLEQLLDVPDSLLWAYLLGNVGPEELGAPPGLLARLKGHKKRGTG